MMLMKKKIQQNRKLNSLFSSNITETLSQVQELNNIYVTTHTEYKVQLELRSPRAAL